MRRDAWRVAGMQRFSTDALIRWVIQWDHILDGRYPLGPARWDDGVRWWELAHAKNAAITELLRRGVSSSRWGYTPPWGRRVAV